MKAEEVLDKITRINDITQSLYNQALAEKITWTFYDNWAKRWYRIKIIILEQYAKKQAVEFTGQLDMVDINFIKKRGFPEIEKQYDKFK